MTKRYRLTFHVKGGQVWYTEIFAESVYVALEKCKQYIPLIIDAEFQKIEIELCAT